MGSDIHPGSQPGEAAIPCLNCGETLVGRSCKLVCPRCHFFFSCSDLEPMPQQAPKPGKS